MWRLASARCPDPGLTAQLTGGNGHVTAIYSTETAMLLARLIWLLVMLAAALSPFFGEPDE